MKKLLLLALTTSIVTLSLFSQENKGPVKVLFLGNSYTYYNDGVDLVLKQIASSLGDEVETLSNSPGGYWLEYHCTNTTSLEYIQQQEWDYVVLQEQSQKPAFSPAQVEAETYPYAEILCDSIHNNSVCTTPVFFMTWGRENGDSDNCPYYPPICTYEGMQWRLRQSYVEMAELNDGIVAPVGMVWKAIRESNPEIDLYQADESHPTDHGTYIAACTFYATLFHKSPFGAYYPAELDETTANLIQNTAWNVVTDSLDTWLIDTTTLRVDFEPVYTTKSVYANFENYTENADSCFWKFGDGETAWQFPNPFYEYSQYDMMYHTYPAEAEYDICLTAYKACETKQVCKTRYIFISDIPDNNTSLNNIYPNPVTGDVLYAPKLNKQKYELYTIDGKLIDKSFITNEKIKIENLKTGFYLLVINGQSYRINVVR